MYTSKQANEKKSGIQISLTLNRTVRYLAASSHDLQCLSPDSWWWPQRLTMWWAISCIVVPTTSSGCIHCFDKDCVLPVWKHTSNRRVVMAKPLDFLHPQFDHSRQGMDQGCHQGPDPHLSPCGLGEGHGPHCIQLMLAYTPSQRVHDNPCHCFQQVTVEPPL